MLHIFNKDKIKVPFGFEALQFWGEEILESQEQNLPRK
jgi:hypothetical protein